MRPPGAPPPPRATTHGPAAGELQEGAEDDAEKGDAAEVSEAAAAAEGASEAAAAAAAAARVRPLRLADWGTMTRGRRQRLKQQGGSVGSEYSAGAPLAAQEEESV